MRCKSGKTGLTLVEMVIAMAIMAIVFAVILPQFRAILNSWESKSGAAETLQNGRVLIDHLCRNLSAAVRITAVSDASQTSGYIEFEDNDANTLRYDVDADNYVEFGLVGDLYELAGPVSQFQFSCYDACDLDNPITEVNDIRSVKVQTTLTNSFAPGRDITFNTQVYLRTNSASGTEEDLTMGTPFEYNTFNGQTPALAQIDSTHYLCAYEGSGSDGWAVVLTVDTGNGTITKETPFRFEQQNGKMPALSKIDDTHYLCAYTRQFSDGQVVVLTVDTGNWTISKETLFEYDSSGSETVLSQIDSSHYLCAYQGPGADGWSVVLTVNTGTWEITKETPFEYGTSDGKTLALAQIDSTHYLCAYEGSGSDGWAVVLAVDTGTWNITMETPFEYDTSQGRSPALAQIDDTHYLCAYGGPGSDGWAVVLTVDTGNWSISKGTAYEYDTSDGVNPALAQIDPNNYLCAYEGPGSGGWAAVLAVDSNNWTISRGVDLEFDTSAGLTPALAEIDPNNYLCVYEGTGSDGWSVVLSYNPATGVSP